jgi:hypothetical protein
VFAASRGPELRNDWLLLLLACAWIPGVSDWTVAIVAVTAFVLFFAVVFSLVAFLGWRGLNRDDNDD